MDAQPVTLLGVDVINLDRRTDELRALVGRVVAADEILPEADDALEILACVAVKEAVIKAVGGRPPGFSWLGMRVGPDEDSASSTTMHALVTEMSAKATTTVRRVRCELSEPMTDAAKRRMGSDRAVAARGCWGTDDRRLYAAVLLEEAR